MTFASEGWEDEYIFVYTSDKFSGHITECNEGELAWIDKDKIMDLNLWDGDRIFLDIMINSDKLFSIKLSYKGDDIVDKQLYVY
jgi:8-oxo-dGTP diphosphatase